MNDALASFVRQKGKNMTLLIVCGFVIALTHREAAASVFAALCLAVGAPAVAEKWQATPTGEN